MNCIIMSWQGTSRTGQSRPPRDTYPHKIVEEIACQKTRGTMALYCPNALQINYTAYPALNRQTYPQHKERPIGTRGYSRQP